MRHLANFAYLLHIRPWEIGDLQVDEFLALCDWIDDYVRSREED